MPFPCLHPTLRWGLAHSNVLSKDLWVHFFPVPVLGHSVTQQIFENLLVALMTEPFAVITAGAINAHLRLLFRQPLLVPLFGTTPEGS